MFKVQDLNVLEEVLRMILEIINSCLSNQIQHNPNLVYALLYKKDIFDPFRNHQNFNDVIQNLDSVINYFSDKLKQVQTDLSVNEVLSTITQGTLVWPSHKLKVSITILKKKKKCKNFVKERLMMAGRGFSRNFPN